MVSVMKMNACKVTIRMWKIAQPSDSRICDPNSSAIENRPSAAHQRDQDEDHFAGIHVAEQTQRQ